jgi:hypothetical protein
MANERISFAQFGEGFVILAITPKVIGTSIDAALRKMGTKSIHQKEGPAEVNARVRSRGCEVKRLSPAELAIFIPLTMDMDVRILGVVPEKYNVDVVVEVRFVVEAYRPLSLLLSVKPIPLSAVSVRVQGSSWTKIAQGLGELADKVRKAVAQEVWAAFNTPEVQQSRTVDVLQAIQRAHQGMLAGGRDGLDAVEAPVEVLPEGWNDFVEPNAYTVDAED